MKPLGIFLAGVATGVAGVVGIFKLGMYLDGYPGGHVDLEYFDIEVR